MRSDLAGLKGNGSTVRLAVTDAGFEKLLKEEIFRLTRAADNLSSMVMQMDGPEKGKAIHHLTTALWERILLLEKEAHPDELERSMCMASRFLFREFERFRVRIEDRMKA